jgi:hypothetical protein
MIHPRLLRVNGVQAALSFSKEANVVIVLQL